MGSKPLTAYYGNPLPLRRGGWFSYLRQLPLLIERLEQLMTVLDDLIAQVHATEAVEQSAIVAIQGLVAQLANTTDPAAIAAITAELQAKTAPLAAAIAAVPAPAPAATSVAGGVTNTGTVAASA